MSQDKLEYEQMTLPNLKSSFTNADYLDFNSAARMAMVSSGLGLPKQAIRHNMQMAEQHLQIKQVEQDAGLASWASQEPENAAVVKADSDKMLDVDKNIDAVLFKQEAYNPTQGVMSGFSESPQTFAERRDIVKPEQKSDGEGIGFFDKIAKGYEVGGLEVELAYLADQFRTAEPEQYERIRQDIITLQTQITKANELLGTDILDSLHPAQVARWLPQLQNVVPYLAKNLTTAFPTGVVLGAGTGSMAAGVGAIPGAIGGGITGLATGATMANFESSMNLERNLFLAELAQEKDENGNYLPIEDLRLFSNLYGGLSAAVESVGVGAVANVFGITDLIKGLGEKQAKQQVKDYVKQAAKDKTLAPIFKDIAKTIGLNAFIEGGEELTQQLLSNITESFAKSSIAENYNTDFEPVELTEGLGQSFVAGAALGGYLGGGGAVIRGSIDANNVRKQQAFTEQQIAINGEVNKMQIKGANADMTESFLKHRHPSLNTEVYAQADALLQLAQDDSSLLTELNIDLVQLEEYANAGLDMPINLASMHARLDEQQFNSVSQIMKADFNGYNALESAEYEARLEQDQWRIEEAVEEFEAYENELNYELDVLAQEIRQQVAYLPSLQTQAEIQTSGGVDQYVKTHVDLTRRMAERLAERSGQNPADILRKWSFGREAQMSAENLAKDVYAYDSQYSFMDQIYGRLDRDSLEEDVADNLEARYGKGFFKKRGKGYISKARAKKLIESGQMTKEEIAEKNRNATGGSSFDQLAEEDGIKELLDTTNLNSTDALAERLMSGNELFTVENRGRRRQVERAIKRASEGKQQALLQGGGVVVGHIPQEVAKSLPLQKTGNIILTNESLTHIEDSHGKQIRDVGFEDAKSFVNYVIQNVDAVYKEKDNRTFSLVVRNEKPNKVTILKLEFSEDNYYRIKTAFPIRSDSFDKKTPLWERAQTNHIKDTPGAVSGNSGVKDNISFTVDNVKLYQSELQNPLVVTHGIYADNIIEADKLGGLPVPSLGISKADEVLTNFGDIILVGDTQMLDGTPTFSNDIYSARFPEVVYSGVNKERAKELSSKLDKYSSNLGENSELKEFDYFLFTDINKDKFHRVLESDIRNLIGFLEENNIDYSLTYKTQSLKGFASNKDFINYVKSLNNDSIVEGSKEHKDISQIYKDVLKKKTGQSENRFIDSNGLLKIALAEAYVYDVKQYEKSQENNKEVDFTETIKELKSLIEKNGLSALYKEKNKKVIDELFINPKITIGNKRVDFTLDNVVKAMSDKKIVGKEKTLNFSNGQLIASRAKKFKNIDEIKKNRDKIKIEDESFNGYKQNIENLLESFRTSLYDYATYKDSFTLFDDALRSLSKLTKKPTKEQLRKSLESFDFLNVPDDVLTLGLNAIQEIDKGLVAYFEAKPQRAVSLDEFIGAVIPVSTDKKVIDILDKNNIKYTFYDGTNQNMTEVFADFSRQLNQENNVLFQLQQNKDEVRGSIEKLADDSYIINLFEKANLSTLVHELSHFFFLEMQEMERAGLANDSLKSDMQILRNWLEMDDSEDFTVANTKGDTLEQKQERLVDLQERLARGFEQYLREGKSPVKELNSMFERFAKWLKRIYNHALKLNVAITPEVSQVFDRMLATEFEIESAANQNYIVTFTTDELNKLGLNSVEQGFLKGLTGEIKDEAEKKLNMARRTARAATRRKIIDEVNELVDNMPVYIARAETQSKKLNYDSVTDVMGDDFASKLMKKMPVGSVKKNGGLSAQELAAELGYSSTESYLNDIYNAESKGTLKNRMVNERLNYEDENFRAEDFLFETQAFANQEAKIAIALNEKVNGKDKKPPLDASIKKFAEQIIYNMDIKDALVTNKFMTTARSLYKKERQEIIRGNYELALQYNTQARTNIAMAQISRKLNEDLTKFQNKINRYVKNKKANRVAKFWVNKLAYTFNMQRQDPRLWESLSNDDIVKWANEYGVDVDFQFLYSQANPRNMLSDDPVYQNAQMQSYKDISYNLFSLLQEQIETIIHVETDERMIETRAGKIELARLADEIADSIYKDNPEKKVNPFARENKQLSTVTDFFTSLLKVDTIARLLNKDTLGIVWQYIVKPINLANFNFLTRARDVKKNLESLFSVYSEKELKDMRYKKSVVEGFSDKPISKETIIAIALNMGNEGNKQRLVSGYAKEGKDAGNLSDAQIKAVLDTLDKKDWDFVQAVWDYFETFQKETFDQEEKATGVRPLKVEAVPIETAYGTYRGGYFPIVYDRSKSAKAPNKDAVDVGKQAFNVPSVEHGNTKERTASLNIPLKLDLDTIPNSLMSTIHNLAFRLPVKEVSKLLRNTTISTAIEATAGVEQFKAMQDWLVDVAAGVPKNQGNRDAFFKWARNSSSVMFMGYKLTTIMMQPAGLLHAASEIGAANVAIGIAETSKNLPRAKEYLELIYSKSNLMRFRAENVDREVSDFNNQIMIGGNKYLKKIKDNAFTPMSYMQLWTVDIPVWWGAYQKGLKDFKGDEAKAVDYADNAVEITQGAGSMKDLARIQRGSETQRAFTMFYTFFSAVYQIMYRRSHQALRKKDLASALALANYVIVGMILSNVASEYLAGRGYDEEEKEDESFAEWAVKLNLLYPVQTVPYLRDIANGLLGDYGYSLSPAGSAPEAVIKGMKKIADFAYNPDEYDDDDKVKDATLAVVKGGGFLFASPWGGNQATGMLREFWDYLDGTDPEFDFFRILMGKRNKE